MAMKPLLLAVLLSVMQAAPPVPRQAPDSTNQSPKKGERKSSQHQGPIAPAPTPSNLPEKAASENTPANNPTTPNTEQSVRIREIPSVSVARDWMDRTTWAFGAILVVVGIVGVCAAYRTLRAIELQTTHLRNSVIQATNAARAAKTSADAVIASERAWIVAELAPICVKFGNWWHRPSGNAWAALSNEEIMKGDHLKHKLKLTNMGRTPAHILSFQIGYSCLSEGVTDLPEGTSGDIVAVHPFDRLLAAGGAMEVLEPIIDVNWYINSSDSIEVIRAISELKNTAVFHGWVRYQHVFSRDDVIEEPFCYSYSPQDMRLNRVAGPKAKQTNESQNPN